MSEVNGVPSYSVMNATPGQYRLNTPRTTISDAYARKIDRKRAQDIEFHKKQPEDVADGPIQERADPEALQTTSADAAAVALAVEANPNAEQILELSPPSANVVGVPTNIDGAGESNERQERLARARAAAEAMKDSLARQKKKAAKTLVIQSPSSRSSAPADNITSTLTSVAESVADESEWERMLKEAANEYSATIRKKVPIEQRTKSAAANKSDTTQLSVLADAAASTDITHNTVMAEGSTTLKSTAVDSPDATNTAEPAPPALHDADAAMTPVSPTQSSSNDPETAANECPPPETKSAKSKFPILKKCKRIGTYILQTMRRKPGSGNETASDAPSAAAELSTSSSPAPQPKKRFKHRLMSAMNPFVRSAASGTVPPAAEDANGTFTTFTDPVPTAAPTRKPTERSPLRIFRHSRAWTSRGAWRQQVQQVVGGAKYSTEDDDKNNTTNTKD
ncbi:hypothetical protein HK104_010970 [Borealophlyctis nickersoniae]|nr:hypothetical protein HK104_010970 [Borealophlyctis nickersoniae]